MSGRKPVGYVRKRLRTFEVVVITLGVVGLSVNLLARDWSQMLSTTLIVFTFWAWVDARRDSDSWQAWFDRTSGRRS